MEATEALAAMLPGPAFGPSYSTIGKIVNNRVNDAPRDGQCVGEAMMFSGNRPSRAEQGQTALRASGLQPCRIS